MAKADRKSYGAGQQDQGKGDGSGGMSPIGADILPETEILSNRDKARHSDGRGLDSAHIRNEQRRAEED